MGGGPAHNTDTKTVVVLGAAYGGARAAQILASTLPDDWRLILVDRNSHANHVYVMPRFAVLPEHEFKAFIPYTGIFLQDKPRPQHVFLSAHVLSLQPHAVTLSKAFPELGIPDATIPFDYAVYALGSHLPPPLDLWGKNPSDSSPPNDRSGLPLYHGLKSEGCAWFKGKQVVVKDSPTILVVGGGALGIQFATDIKAVYPEKEVTLLHSRSQLLPRFDIKMHDEVLSTCFQLGIKVILGERLDLDTVDPETQTANRIDARGRKVVRTVKGREIAADLLLLCTGQKTNSGIIAGMDPSTVNEASLVRVLPTLQVHNKPVPRLEDSDSATSPSSSSGPDGDISPEAAYPHIFAIGDVADAFGAIPAGHNAYAQGEVAAQNIVKLIKQRERPDTSPSEHPVETPVADDAHILSTYKPGPPAIKVSLGLTKAVYQVGPSIGVKHDGQPDLQAAAIWPLFGTKVEKEEDMYA